MRYITLKYKNGTRLTKVDNEDFNRISPWTWRYEEKGSSRYAYKLDYIPGSSTKENRSGLQRRVYLHRYIVGATKGLEVDHINGDGLDNRKCNLRLATRKQNMSNIKKNKKTRFPYKGVTLSPGNSVNPYAAQIMVDYKHIHLGVYKTVKEAAKAYDRAAIKYFDKYARLNFPYGHKRVN